jgi:hypothetical protein
MPLFSKHSNRSKHALDDSAASGTTTATTTATSTITTTATTPTSPGSPASALGKTGEARATQQPEAFALQQRQQQLLLQPQLQQQQQQQSQNYAPSPIDTGSPTIDYPHPGTLVRPQSTYSSPFPLLVPVSDRRSVDDLVLNNSPRSQLASPKSQSPNPAVEQKKSRGLFERIRSSSRTPDTNPSTSTSTPSQSYIVAPGHSRRLSKRLHSPPAIRTSSITSPEQLQHLDWQLAQDPRSYLPSPQEHVEHTDPYPTLQEQAQQPTIRTVPNDLDGQKQQLDVPNNHHNQGSQVAHDPYSQNFENVSQLSFDTSAEPKEDTPVLEHSTGNSPTGNLNSQRSENSNRTPPATRGQREVSHPMSMPASAGISQTRKAADPKQAMQGLPGPPDGAPPNYRPPFTGNPTPTTIPSTSTLPAGQGTDYRGGPPQREQFGATGGERGRSTPPPPPAVERDVNDAYKEICEFTRRSALGTILISSSAKI